MKYVYTIHVAGGDVLNENIIPGFGSWIYRRFADGGTGGGDEESFEEKL